MTMSDKKPINPMNFLDRYDMENDKYFYFIEEIGTGLWLKNITRMPQGNTPHTTIYYKNEDYWTRNPQDALMSVSKQLMEETLENLIKNESSFMMTDKYGIYKNVKITEHEFVNHPKS